MAANKYLIESYDQMLGRGQDKSMEAFVKGATGVLKNEVMQEQQKIAGMQKGHEKDMERLGKLGDLGTLSQEEKNITKQWFRGKRDEYNDLSVQFQKTKDPALQDKMDDINSAIMNVASNVKRYNENTVQWGADLGNVAYGSQTFDYDNVSNIFGKKGTHKMSYDENGNMSFIGARPSNEDVLSGKKEGGASVISLNDVDDSWNLQNKTVELFEADMRANLEKNKMEGKFFSVTKTQSDLYKKLVEGGPESVQVFAETDLSGTYGDKNLSFQKLWKNGKMSAEYYEDFPLKDGTDWMFDDANSDKLAGLMSKHMASVHEEINNKLAGPVATFEDTAGTAGERDATRKMNQGMAQYEADLTGTEGGGYQIIPGMYNTLKHHGNVAGYFKNRLKKGFGVEFIENGDQGTGYYITKQIVDDSDPDNLKYAYEKSLIQRAKIGQNSFIKDSTHLRFKNIWRFMDQSQVTLTSENNIMLKKD